MWGFILEALKLVLIVALSLAGIGMAGYVFGYGFWKAKKEIGDPQTNVTLTKDINVNLHNE